MCITLTLSTFDKAESRKWKILHLGLYILVDILLSEADCKMEIPGDSGGEEGESWARMESR